MVKRQQQQAAVFFFGIRNSETPCPLIVEFPVAQCRQTLLYFGGFYLRPLDNVFRLFSALVTSLFSFLHALKWRMFILYFPERH